MLPRLSNVPQLNNVVSDYLSELQKQHFEGDIASNYADRLSLSTDNSVYQQLPQAILFPKSVADVVRITKLANKEKYLQLLSHLAVVARAPMGNLLTTILLLTSLAT